MNVTVFGATGAIGSLTVAELLGRGHRVTAYVRNRAKVPPEWTVPESRVRVVVGQMSDATAIDDAVAGAEAIVSALGPSMDRRASGLPLVEGTRHILESMRRHGVTRYIGHGTPSVADPLERRTARTRLIALVARLALPRAYEELLGMTDLVRRAGAAGAEQIRWTIVRFTAPRDGPKKSLPDGRGLRVGFFGEGRLGLFVTRADIAAFTAAQVDDDTYLDRAPAVSN